MKHFRDEVMGQWRKFFFERKLPRQLNLFLLSLLWNEINNQNTYRQKVITIIIWRNGTLKKDESVDDEGMKFKKEKKTYCSDLLDAKRPEQSAAGRL
jgi:hypothetical protein